MEKCTNLNEMWLNSCRLHGEKPAYGDRHARSETSPEGKISEIAYFQPHTFNEVEESIIALGAGLAAIGLNEGDGVGIVAENCLRWSISDFAVSGNRAHNVPRGVSSTDAELIYILNHAEVRFLFVQDETQLARILQFRSSLPKLEKIIVMAEGFFATDTTAGIFSFDQILEAGKEEKFVVLFQQRRKHIHSDDIFTLMYTSGTTGTPKGIPLTHANVMPNVESVSRLLKVVPSDRLLSPLPIWHVFERTIEYIALSAGCSVWYTDKLTIIKDLLLVKPTFLASVPRLWLSVHTGILSNIRRQGKEKLFSHLYAHSSKVIAARRQAQGREFALIGEKRPRAKAGLLDYAAHFVADKLIYRKIRAKLGGRLKAGVSGGGSMPEYIDDFFEAMGISLIDGYGLTETSPILTVRSFDHLIPYTAGLPLPETEIQIIGDNDEEIKDSGKGTIWVHGPQVMEGYYKNPEETARVMKTDEKGRRWFNTGDIGRRTRTGDISIIGRNKDTIVLLGGENIEPEPIEATLLASRFIDQVMVCGQNQEHLTVLVVPNEFALGEECRKRGIEFTGENIPALSAHPEIRAFFMELIQSMVSVDKGFKEIELLHNFAFTQPFVYEDDTLTQTFKTRRFNIDKRDDALIRKMYPHYYDTGGIKDGEGA